MAGEVRVARDVAQRETKQEQATVAVVAMQEAAVKAYEGQMSPSHGQEAEEEEGDADPQTASTRLK